MSLALITGASRGIGAHLAAGFARAGYDLALVATGAPTATADVARESGVRAEAYEVDVRDGEQVDAVIAEIEAGMGGIDVLVNNAGRIDSEVPLWEADPREWWDVMEVNVRGPFLFARAVVPRMIERGGGRIINVNSGSGTRDAGSSTAYAASKTALFRIGGALHLAGYEKGIRAFEMAPGVVRTDMTRGMRLHEGRTEWTEPADVIALALALASGRADHLSGTYVRAGETDPNVPPEERRSLGLVTE